MKKKEVESIIEQVINNYHNEHIVPIIEAIQEEQNPKISKSVSRGFHNMLEVIPEHLVLICLGLALSYWLGVEVAAWAQ